MIWKAARHMIVTEILTWAIFLVIAAVLTKIALQFFSSPTVSVLLVVLWFAVFVWVYRKRYKHF
ncbi:MAG TPA: hypothetical protein VMI94_09325 [Bryobacteraceae bacterium]|nr:hypothetical protein [Bryobacteraceae bacterium]